MKLGIGLPTYFGNLVAPPEVLAWARRAEALGFDAVAVHDKPKHDTWEPLITLAAVAAVTSRIRLLTASLVLPTRDEALVVKQAAVVDAISGGRLELGLVVGNNPADYAAFGRSWAGRGATFERQLARLDELWAEASTTRETGAAIGPAPVAGRRPRLWIGGYVDAALDRAVRWGDGYLFGAPPVGLMARRVPQIRALAAAAGRPEFPIGGLAYVVASADPAAHAAGERVLTRYYGQLSRPFAQLVHCGDADAMRTAVASYRAAGLDELHLIPLTTDRGQLDALAVALLG